MSFDRDESSALFLLSENNRSHKVMSVYKNVGSLEEEFVILGEAEITAKEVIEQIRDLRKIVRQNSKLNRRSITEVRVIIEEEVQKLEQQSLKTKNINKYKAKLNQVNFLMLIINK